MQCFGFKKGKETIAVCVEDVHVFFFFCGDPILCTYGFLFYIHLTLLCIIFHCVSSLLISFNKVGQMTFSRCSIHVRGCDFLICLVV